MRTIVAACVASALLVGAGSLASAAPGADSFCPAATQYVEAYGSTVKNSPNDAEKILTAAQAAQSAYEVCDSAAMSNGQYEPIAHYDETREAQFGYVSARALLVMGHVDEAKAQATAARKMAASVVDWTPSNVSVSLGASADSSHSDRVSDVKNSNYHDTATQVRDALDALLGIIAKLPTTGTAAPPKSR